MPLLPSHTLIVTTSLALLTLSTLLIISPTTILSSNTIAILGSSMHIRQASFIPAPGSYTNTGAFAASNRIPPPPKINPLTSLTHPPKTTLTTPERELLALLGFILALASLTQLILATPLRYSKSSLTTTTTTTQNTTTSKPIRKPTSALAEQIHTLLTTQTLFQTLCTIHVLLTAVLVAAIYLLKSDRYGGSNDRTNEGWDYLANDVVFAAALSDMLFWGYLYTVVAEERREVLGVLERRRVMDEEDERDERR